MGFARDIWNAYIKHLEELERDVENGVLSGDVFDSEASQRIRKTDLFTSERPPLQDFRRMLSGDHNPERWRKGVTALRKRLDESEAAARKVTSITGSWKEQDERTRVRVLGALTAIELGIDPKAMSRNRPKIERAIDTLEGQLRCNNHVVLMPVQSA